MSKSSPSADSNFLVACSFCGSSGKELGVVVGPGVSICAGCTATAAKDFAERREKIREYEFNRKMPDGFCQYRNQPCPHACKENAGACYEEANDAG